MTEPLTVTQFVEAVNFALDALASVTVEGEVEEYKIIHNKWVTFRLKDSNSSVGCFMTVWQLRVQIEDGMLVRATGKPRLRDKGFFSFVLESVQPAGEGALRRAFELLKKKLETEGLFATERKRPLPDFPEHIALITSRDAAAYSDFLKVLAARLGGLTISFIHTQVQGSQAPDQIINALTHANTKLKHIDVIVLVRGGGSLEDLQAFNDEHVVRAVAASRTPTIVGVGHERDVTLAELAADVRASTPSNAAELLVRSRQEIAQDIASRTNALVQAVHQVLDRDRLLISRAVGALHSRALTTAAQVRRQIDLLRAIPARLRADAARYLTAIAHARHVLGQRAHERLDEQAQRVVQILRILQSFSPVGVLARGYSITRTADGRLLRSAADTRRGEQITTQLHHGRLASTVDKIFDRSAK